MGDPSIAIADQDLGRVTVNQGKVEALPLLELMKRVAFHSDQEALTEIVGQRTFSGDGLTLTAFLHRLSATSLHCLGKSQDLISQLAYDLTLDKFLLMPGDHIHTETQSEAEPRRTSTDCRYYYKGFLAWVEKQEDRIPRGTLLREAWVTEAFAGFVKRQFAHSCLEAKRRLADRFSSRYVWNLDGRGSITVRLPRTLSASKRRHWLETHIPDVDPTRAEERKRIQSIIDRELSFGGQVSLDQVDGEAALASDPPDWKATELDRLGFPQFVADEKAESIELQRPAIRALGPANLRLLVLKIFDNLVSGECSEEVLASWFGLSKTAYSHFAGSKWDCGSDGTTAVPDLFVNVAHVLARHPQFVDAAEELGFLKVARATLNRVAKIRLREATS